jgi:uncharacterized protein (DUF4415 family)
MTRRPASLRKSIHWPSDAEEAAINRGIALDPDNPEITDAVSAWMRPAGEVIPKVVEAYHSGKLGRPTIGDEPKVHIGFRLAADVVAAIRGTGRGYNARVEQVLRAAFFTEGRGKTDRLMRRKSG